MIPKFRCYIKSFPGLEEIMISELERIREVEGIIFLEKIVKLYSNGHINDIGFMKFEDIVLMQWTGLQDKNGKDIYEGDVVDFSLISSMMIEGGNYGRLGTIINKFSPIQFFIEDTYSLSYDKFRNKVKTFWKMDSINELEVIGNIYENPELLEFKNE